MLTKARIFPGSIVLAVLLSLKARAITGIYPVGTRGGRFCKRCLSSAKLFFQKHVL
jgi:hypothetical protein